jgi:hypothetical protein
VLALMLLVLFIKSDLYAPIQILLLPVCMSRQFHQSILIM